MKTTFTNQVLDVQRVLNSDSFRPIYTYRKSLGCGHGFGSCDSGDTALNVQLRCLTYFFQFNL